MSHAWLLVLGSDDADAAPITAALAALATASAKAPVNESPAAVVSTALTLKAGSLPDVICPVSSRQAHAAP